MKTKFYFVINFIVIPSLFAFGENAKFDREKYEEKIKELLLVKDKYNNIDYVKEQLKELAEKYNPTQKTDNLNHKLTASASGTIEWYIQEADKNYWSDPSPERLKRIQEVQEVIEPYKKLLIYLAEPTKNEQGSLNALGILHFAKPDEYLQKELRRIANLPNPRGAASRAYLVLINLGLDSPEIREEIVQRINNFKSHKETPEDSEVFYGSRNYQLKEAIPAYLKQLQLPQATNYVYDGRVRLIAEAVENMGSDATILLPELKKHLALMKERGMHFTDINTLQVAIDKIEKNISSPILAMNGSGPLKRYEEKVVPIQSTNTAFISSSTTNVTQTVANELTEETKTMREKENAIWLKWALVIIGLGLIASLLIKSLGRNKR